MILDKQLEFASDQALTGDAISANVYDMGAKGAGSELADLAQRTDLTLVARVGTDLNLLTSLTITLESDSAVGLDSAPVVHCQRTLTLAELNTNKTFVIGRLSVPRTAGRYLGVRFNVNGTDPSAGAISAWLVTDAQENPAN